MKYVTCSQEKFMRLFDSEDFVKTFNDGSVDMYEKGDCVGYIEEMNGEIICVYSVNNDK